MKDIVTPVPPEEVRGMIKKCLENAALENYTRLSAETKIEGMSYNLYFIWINKFVIRIMIQILKNKIISN